MKNRAAIYFILLFFASMTLGKGVSDYVESPRFEFILSGSVQATDGSAKRGAAIFFDLARGDSSLAMRSYYSTVTNDSGLFSFELNVISGFQTGVRIIASDGKDTTTGPWIFSDKASRKEETEVISTTDCNEHKKVIPSAEIYTFPEQHLIFQ